MAKRASGSAGETVRRETLPPNTHRLPVHPSSSQHLVPPPMPSDLETVAMIERELKGIAAENRNELGRLKRDLAESKSYVDAVAKAEAQSIESRLEARVRDEIDAIKVTLNWRGFDAVEPGRKLDTAESKAFSTYLR